MSETATPRYVGEDWIRTESPARYAAVDGILPDADAVMTRLAERREQAGEPPRPGLSFVLLVKVPAAARLLGPIRDRVRAEYGGTVEGREAPDAGGPGDWDIFKITLPAASEPN